MLFVLLFVLVPVSETSSGRKINCAKKKESQLFEYAHPTQLTHSRSLPTLNYIVLINNLGISKMSSRD